MLSESEFELSLQVIDDCCEKLRIDNQIDWERYLEGKMTPEEKMTYNSKSRKYLINFTETECGQHKFQFLLSYLQSDSSIQNKYKDTILKFYSPKEFAVLAVRLKSSTIIDLALQSFEISIPINNDFRDDISNLTLIYHAIKILSFNPDEFFNNYSRMINEPAKKLIDDFVSRTVKQKTLWCMGYEEENYENFGFVWIGGDSDYRTKKAAPKTYWWKFW